MFKTKRFLYTIIKNKFLGKPGCHSIIGARKVGKTVLLKQLNGDLNNSIYLDCTDIGRKGEYFDFEGFFNSNYERGVSIFLIDEVCKLGIDNVSDFIYACKLCSGWVTIIITGSVAGVITKCTDEICRGEYFELPPFMYSELLCWMNGINEISEKDVVRLSSYVG